MQSETELPLVTSAVQELSVPAALELAVQLIRNADVQLGVTICDRVLAAAPDHPDALHYKGMALYHTDKRDEGMALVARAVEVSPTYTDAWNNLGNMLSQNDQQPQAEAAYRTVLTLQPEHADAWANLGSALKEQDKLDEAEQAVRKALSLAPEHADALHILGNVLRLQKRPLEALDAYKQALLLRPSHPDSYRRLGAAFYGTDQIQEAAQVYGKWLALEPTNPYPKHLLAACTQKDIPDRASDEFVARSFDGFASSFDRVLHALKYRAPDLVAQAVKEYLGEGTGALDVADAGCGTGLCGPLLLPFAKTLIGVDLSAAMVSRAKQRTHESQPVYTELHIAELTAFFATRPAQFDLIVSADTLCYFGRLEAPLQALAASLRPQGVLVFTLERADEGSASEGFLIGAHGRYSQTETYLRTALKQVGLAAKLIDHAHLRMERGMPVDGLLVLARKM